MAQDGPVVGRMSFSEILLLSLALAADAFSVALCIGLTHAGSRQVFRLAFHFGLFQALMPTLGALFGELLLLVLARAANWIAFAVLAGIGLKMVVEAVRVDPARACDRYRTDPTRGLTLVGLSTATAIDAFGAGIGLATRKAPLAPAVVTIGIVAALCTWLAMRLGARVGARVGARAGILGGVILIGLAVKMLIGIG
jgi:putative Mn2+ efflux pump MntP